MTPDPYAPHLRQADDCFARGEVIKAGQIWQAILKQQPTHTVARERLMALKQHLLAQREAEARAALAVLPPLPAPIPDPTPAQRPAPAPVAPPVALPEPPVLAAVAEAAFPPPPEEAPVQVQPSSPSPEAPVAPLLESAPADPMSPAPAAPPAPTEPAPPPSRAVTGALDPDRLLADGCTLYDMGQIEDALRKWEQLLTLDPAHALARNYANGARRELGLPPLSPPEEAAPAQGMAFEAEADLEKLLREASQLYDMGLPEEAITKWERVLSLDSNHPEVVGYLNMARAELSHRPAPAAAPKPASPGQPEADSLDLKLRQAEHLLTLQRHEEAAFTFQQALRLSPGNARALDGLERCRKPSAATMDPAGALHSFTPVMALDSRGRIEMAEPDDRTLVISEPQGVQPPAALLKAAPAARKGLSVPDRIRELTTRLPWLKNTKVLAMAGGGLLVLIVGFALVHSHLRDQALREDVLAARRAAVAPLAQQAQAPDLAETPQSLREEAETALPGDPLRAFLRAEFLVNLNPKDAAAAQLLEKTRAALPGGVTGSSLPEFQKHLQNGDLEAAFQVMDALLRAHPEDADLRARSGRLQLALCVAHANQAKWDEAHEDLLRGRSLFPGDKTWQIRLRLLDQLKTLPKAEQASWITLLG